MSAFAARRRVWARLIGSAVVIACGLGESRTTNRLRDERSCLPRCHPHSALPHSRDRRARVLPCRSALPAIAGALRRSLLAPAARAASRSVRRLPGPFPAVVVPARTKRRISGSTCDGYSSRSQPVVRDGPRSMGRAGATRQGRRARLSFAPDMGGWRRGWDSNPRSLATQRFSRAPPSTARPPLQRAQDSAARRTASTRRAWRHAGRGPAHRRVRAPATPREPPDPAGP